MLLALTLATTFLRITFASGFINMKCPIFNISSVSTDVWILVMKHLQPNSRDLHSALLVSRTWNVSTS
jgi:hypothetical protein